MKLSSALSMLDAALAEAKRIEVQVCVTILDAAAWPMAFARMEGVPLGVIDVSRKKARTAILFHMDSADFAVLGRPDGEAYTLENTNDGLTSFGGGILLRNTDGTVLGSIGVSGASTPDDIAIARVAARALAGI